MRLRDRGTGNAITAAANRIFSIMTPIIAMFANLNTTIPVYVSGALFITADVLASFSPLEPRVRISLCLREKSR